MFNVHREVIEWAGRTLVLETGKMARQADGAVLATYGETVVLCVLGLSVLWMGVYPKPIMQAMDASVVKLTQHMAQSKLQ